jgi:hypothetical protein
MTNWINITRIAQNTYGVLAQVTGIPVNVYRLTANSNGNWIQPQNLVVSNLKCDRMPMKAGDKGFEGPSDLRNFWYELMFNGNNFLVGDVFVSNDHVLNKGWVETTYNSTEFVGWCLAENMPTRAPIGARLNTTAQIYTSAIVPDVNNYFNSTLPNRMPIILQNGRFAALNAGQEAAVIPIGVMPYRSYGGDIYNQETANMPPLEKRLLYVPPLPGYQVIAGDEFVFADGSRYNIDSNYHQTVGASGSWYICRKHVTGQGQ